MTFVFQYMTLFLFVDLNLMLFVLSLCISSLCEDTLSLVNATLSFYIDTVPRYILKLKSEKQFICRCLCCIINFHMSLLKCNTLVYPYKVICKVIDVCYSLVCPHFTKTICIKYSCHRVDAQYIMFSIIFISFHTTR